MMRGPLLAALLGSLAFLAAPAFGQGAGAPPGGGSNGAAGPANLCQELLAYAEKKASEPPKEAADQKPQAPAGAPMARTEAPDSGTQGGGSAGPSTSTNLSSQSTAPPTTPISPGAQSAPASSPYASGSSDAAVGASPPGTAASPAEFKLAGGITLQQVRDAAKGGDRGACRETAQELRRAGAALPAALIALAAYEPDPAKR